MVLVTGPPGHGKSTTLASVVRSISQQRAGHIVTLEDPIEYLHPLDRSLITQREVGPHTPTFGRAMRDALRQDADVLVIGELRDGATVRLALGAAITGKLVLATMHSASAAAVVDLVLDLVGSRRVELARQQLAYSLRAVVNQRLLPTADGRGRKAAF